MVQRSASTVVCVVGDAAARLLGSLAAPNVAVLSAPDDDRARAATAAGAHTPYFVHDADPLAAVERAWVRLFEEAGPIGEVEVAAADAIARWRSGTIELPDYYVVTAVDTLSDTRRAWFFGVLHAAAPVRVVPVDPTAAAVLDALDQLAPGPWWPPLDRLLDRIEHRAPPHGPSVTPPPGSPGAPRRLVDA